MGVSIYTFTNIHRLLDIGTYMYNYVYMYILGISEGTIWAIYRGK